MSCSALAHSALARCSIALASSPALAPAPAPAPAPGPVRPLGPLPPPAAALDDGVRLVQLAAADVSPLAALAAASKSSWFLGVGWGVGMKEGGEW